MIIREVEGAITPEARRFFIKEIYYMRPTGEPTGELSISSKWEPVKEGYKAVVTYTDQQGVSHNFSILSTAKTVSESTKMFEALKKSTHIFADMLTVSATGAKIEFEKAGFWGTERKVSKGILTEGPGITKGKAGAMERRILPHAEAQYMREELQQPATPLTVGMKRKGAYESKQFEAEKTGRSTTTQAPVPTKTGQTPSPQVQAEMRKPPTQRTSPLEKPSKGTGVTDAALRGSTGAGRQLLRGEIQSHIDTLKSSQQQTTARSPGPPSTPPPPLHPPPTVPPGQPTTVRLTEAKEALATAEKDAQKAKRALDTMRELAQDAGKKVLQARAEAKGATGTGQEKAARKVLDVEEEAKTIVEGLKAATEQAEGARVKREEAKGALKEAENTLKEVQSEKPKEPEKAAKARVEEKPEDWEQELAELENLELAPSPEGELPKPAEEAPEPPGAQEQPPPRDKSPEKLQTTPEQAPEPSKPPLSEIPSPPLAPPPPPPPPTVRSEKLATPAPPPTPKAKEEEAAAPGTPPSTPDRAALLEQIRARKELKGTTEQSKEAKPASGLVAALKSTLERRRSGVAPEDEEKPVTEREVPSSPATTPSPLPPRPGVSKQAAASETPPPPPSSGGPAAPSKQSADLLEGIRKGVTLKKVDTERQKAEQKKAAEEAQAKAQKSKEEMIRKAQEKFKEVKEETEGNKNEWGED